MFGGGYGTYNRGVSSRLGLVAGAVLNCMLDLLGTKSFASANDGRGFTKGYGDIARLVGVSPQQVKDAVAVLRRQPWFACRRGAGALNHYKIDIPALDSWVNGCTVEVNSRSEPKRPIEPKEPKMEELKQEVFRRLDAGQIDQVILSELGITKMAFQPIRGAWEAVNSVAYDQADVDNYLTSGL